MSDTEPEPTPTEEETPDPGALRERGDKALEKATQLETENEGLRRELALTTAGVPNAGTGALFRKAYDGELTSEAINAAMEEYGIGQEASAPAAPIADPAQAAALGAATQGLAPQIESPATDIARVQRMQEVNREGGNNALMVYLGEQGLLSDPELSAEEKTARLQG